MPDGSDDSRNAPQTGGYLEDHAFAAQSVVAFYPAPVAVPYQRSAGQKEPVARLLALFQAAEALARYLVTLGLADLFHCLAQGDPPGALPADASFDFLRKPTPMLFGKWLAALRATAAALAGQPGRLVEELPRVCAPGGPFDARILGGIVQERNRWTHPDGNIVITPDEAEEVLPRLRPRLEEALCEARFVCRYPLGFFQRLTPRLFALHSCMGTRIDNTVEAYKLFEGPAALAEGVPFVAAPDGRGLLPLWPLLLQRVSPVSGRHTLYTFETLPDKKRPWLAKVQCSAIDVRNDLWYEETHPAVAADHGWLLQRLGAQPAAGELPEGLNLARRLLPSRGRLAGQRLGPYRLHHVIAAGGFGTVYLADDDCGARVAVKVLESDDAVRQFDRFEREFDKLGQAGHPRVVRCYRKDVAVIDGRFYPWYSMEFAVGGDLAARLAERGPDPWADPNRRAAVVRDVRDVAEAVAHLHGLGIVHRDLKPSNVLVMDDGELCLSDFGLAKALVPSQASLERATSAGAVLGTPDYMAPEQRWGQDADRTADVYALGVVLAELATGRHPRPQPDVREGSTLSRFAPLDGLPAPLRRFILRCTDVTPSERPDDARAVLERFTELTQGESVASRRLPLPQPLPSHGAAPGIGGAPAPLDCTGETGVSAAVVQQAQAAWARYLGRQVEEETEIAPGVKMTFVLVPPGRFLMGSPEGEQDRRKDEVQHEVEITRPFYLAKYQVTQAQFEAVTGENPSHFRGADLPVEQVDWQQAADYGDRLTKKCGAGLLYRLPTEAEWEYSCRGGRSSSQPFGIGDGTSLSSDQANFDYSLRKTSRVGSYPANALGLSDMHGNVWEWCADWYGAYPAGLVRDPTGAAEGSARVIRGGSGSSLAGFCRAADRLRFEPGYRDYDLGARLARSFPSGAE